LHIMFGNPDVTSPVTKTTKTKKQTENE